ncbi:MAG: peptidylprolyl isomerase [Proteobacteria bacterium SG_bin9]|nr:MAG: peptidylprolyl isomerase [Proteobacteria bacterium SG_bin9]
MLRGIRRASSNRVGKLIMGTVMAVLIVSFGVWGIADIFKGFGQSTLAKIGRTEITIEQFRTLYTEKLQQIGRQFGRPLTLDQARTFGLDRQVLQQVISEAALDEGARRMGLSQSDAEVVKAIQNDPNFRGVSGNFDPNRFAAIIRQFGFTEQRYIAEQRRVTLRREIAGTLTAGLEPSKTLLDAVSRFQNEQRSIEFVRLGPAQAGTIETPSQDTLTKYFDERKTLFRAPEYRKIAVVAMTPDAIAKWTTISDDDGRKRYEEGKDKLAQPEKRQISQIVFPNADEAKAAREKIAGGLTFEDLAKERKLSATDIDLGIVAKSAVIDTAVANAAFALAANEVSQPVQSGFGFALVKVGKIEPGSTLAYETVADNIKKEIALERARQEVQELHNKMEDERGGGSNIADAAQKLGLTAVTFDVDRSGRGLDGRPVNTGLPQNVDVISGAFASNVGVENDPLQVNGGYIWFEVLGVTPSRERNLDEVKDQVEARWRDDQIATRLRAKATEMIDKLDKGGAKLADEAASLGLKVESEAGFKRDTSPAGIPPTLVQAAFGAAKGTSGQTPGANTSEWIVYSLTDVTVPAVDLTTAEAKRLKDALQRGISDEYVSQYISRLESEIGVSINQAAVAQVTGANNAN